MFVPHFTPCVRCRHRCARSVPDVTRRPRRMCRKHTLGTAPNSSFLPLRPCDKLCLLEFVVKSKFMRHHTSLVLCPPPSTHPKFCRFISLCDNVAWQVSSATKAEYVVVRPSSFIHHLVSTSSSMYNKIFSNVVCERVRLPTSVCNQPCGLWVPFSACERLLCMPPYAKVYR